MQDRPCGFLQVIVLKTFCDQNSCKSRLSSGLAPENSRRSFPGEIDRKRGRPCVAWEDFLSETASPGPQSFLKEATCREATSLRGRRAGTGEFLHSPPACTARILD